MVKKIPLTKCFEISKREIRMFVFINFEWKSILIKIIDKYKMLYKLTYH